MPTSRTSILIFWGVLLSFLFSVIALFTATAFDWLGPLPSIEELQNPSSLMSSEIYSEDGKLLGKYYQRDRIVTTYEAISPDVINVLVATEDERFFRHSGIDLRSVARALWGVITLNPKGGGSTISQQLALNLLIEIDEDNRRARSKWYRAVQKLKEWVVAIKLEKNFTKEEILSLYLNIVPFGDNIYGIKNAAATFFQKKPADLNLEEAAVLIGMLKGNTLYNPRKNPKMALRRRNQVLEQVYNNHFITIQEKLRAQHTPMVIRYLRLDEQAGIATYLREIVREDLKNMMQDVRKSDGTPYNIYKDGLKVYTTIDSKMQEIAERIVSEHLPQMQSIMDAQSAIKTGAVWNDKQDVLWGLAKQTKRWQQMEGEGFKEDEIKKAFRQKHKMRVFAWNKNREKDTVLSSLDSIKYHQQFLQNGFMVMDPNTGFVKVWVGGINYKYFKYDHINIRTKRQAGSSIKPLLYALAIMDLGYNEYTMCPNVEQCFPEYDDWCSHNNDHTNSDNVPLYKGLASSLNNVSAYLIKQLSPRRFVEFLRQANIQSPIPAVPSICLGTPDVSPYEMIWAYSMFPAKGYSVKPVYIKRIEDKHGNIIKNFTTHKNYVISDADAYLMSQLLKNVVDFGTAASLRYKFQVRGEVAGKTGTTNDNADAWFIGFTPNLVGGVWVGCDMPFLSITSNAGYGAMSAMPIFAHFLNAISREKTTLDTTVKAFVRPDDYYRKIRSGMSYSGQEPMDSLQKTPRPNAEHKRRKGHKSLYLN